MLKRRCGWDSLTVRGQTLISFGFDASPRCWRNKRLRFETKMRRYHDTAAHDSLHPVDRNRALRRSTAHWLCWPDSSSIDYLVHSVCACVRACVCLCVKGCLLYTHRMNIVNCKEELTTSGTPSLVVPHLISGLNTEECMSIQNHDDDHGRYISQAVEWQHLEPPVPMTS